MFPKEPDSILSFLYSSAPRFAESLRRPRSSDERPSPSQKNLPELPEVHVLPRLQRVLHKEWNDDLTQMLRFAHPEGHPITVIHANHAAFEIRLERVQDLHIAFVLYNGELRQDLKSRPSSPALALMPTWKHPFAVHETCNPFSMKFHWMLLNVLVSEGFRYIRIFPADCPRVYRIFNCLA